MGARFSRLARKPLETTRRLDQVLDSKPIAAPKHPSTADAIERIKTETESEFQERDSKDENFLGRLKDFKIESTDIKMPGQTSSKLPQSRSKQSGSISSSIAQGKLTSRLLTELFMRNIQAPSVWTNTKIAEHYKIEQNDVDALLKYYSGYAVVQRGELPMPLQDVKFLD